MDIRTQIINDVKQNIVIILLVITTSSCGHLRHTTRISFASNSEQQECTTRITGIKQEKPTIIELNTTNTFITKTEPLIFKKTNKNHGINKNKPLEKLNGQITIEKKPNTRLTKNDTKKIKHNFISLYIELVIAFIASAIPLALNLAPFTFSAFIYSILALCTIIFAYIYNKKRKTFDVGLDLLFGASPVLIPNVIFASRILSNTLLIDTFVVTTIVSTIGAITAIIALFFYFFCLLIFIIKILKQQSTKKLQRKIEDVSSKFLAIILFLNLIFIFIFCAEFFILFV